jgi:hypothetical protein
VCGFTFTILFPKEGKRHMCWVAWTFVAGLNKLTVVLWYASTNGLPSAHTLPFPGMGHQNGTSC